MKAFLIVYLFLMLISTLSDMWHLSNDAYPRTIKRDTSTEVIGMVVGMCMGFWGIILLMHLFQS